MVCKKIAFLLLHMMVGLSLQGDPPKPKKSIPGTSKTKKLVDHCSGGWFFSPDGSKKCFELFHERRLNWDESVRKCEEEGLLTAKPSTDWLAINLRKHLLDKYGDGRVWLGARANGHTYLWERDSTQISLASRLWSVREIRGPTDECTSHLGCVEPTLNHCLSLQVNRGQWIDSPDRPFASYDCSSTQYALCEHKGSCPSGFFQVDGTTECFKILREARVRWNQAKSRCRNEGLQLAQPTDTSAAAIRKYLLDNYGDNSVWLGARRDTVEGEVLWQRYQQWWDLASNIIPDNSSLWYPDSAVPEGGGGAYSSQDDLCLQMLVSQRKWERSPDQPYGLEPCASLSYPLCQAFYPNEK